MSEDEPADLSQVPTEVTWEVGEEEAGQRLDAFLVPRLTWRSRTSIVSLIQSGDVSVDGEPCARKGRKLKQGEGVAVAVPPPDEPVRHEALGRELASRILFEDAHLIAVDKPPGLVVHPVGRTRVNTLIQGLHWLVAHSGRDVPGGLPRICHRLDRDTSGVLVLAKSTPARVALQRVFEGRTVQKTYLAFVQGETPDAETLEAPIGSDPESEIELKMAVRPDGLPARTRYRVQARYPGVTALEVALDTGRQHQIRVHLAHAGFPLLGDVLYGAGPDPRIGRQALHAQVLELPHPIGGQPLRLEAPEPADLLALRRVLAGG